ncbi:MAG TPA: DUF2341 domain-containing protein [Vicinamibacterales bacterium]|nr:DUF2341 domain-containing protein [Vicinamibacterales bacterium]
MLRWVVFKTQFHHNLRGPVTSHLLAHLHARGLQRRNLEIGDDVSLNSNVYINACSGGTIRIGHEVPPIPRGATLDRRAVVAMWILLVVALAVNADRFVQGPAAFLRAHDVSDNTITGLASCGDFWRSSLESVWDGSQLRGWPRAGSPQHPQLFMCVLGGLAPAHFILPVLHALLLALIAVGTYLFVRAFLQRSHESAVASSVLNVTLYFFFHEHPVIPSAILLPPLLGFLAVQGRTLGAKLLVFAGAALILGLSNPPGTLILMPVAHGVLILASPSRDWRRHVVRWGMFWGIYALYYGPAMIAMLREFPESSRSLYKAPILTGTFEGIFLESLLNPAMLSPAAVLIALVGKRTWKGTVLLVLGILAFMALSAGNQVLVQEAGGRFPILVSLSTMYYRMYYLVPVAMLVWAAWLFDASLEASRWTRVRHVVLAVAICAALVHYIPADVTRVFIPYWKYAAVLAAIGVTVAWWPRWSLAVLVVAAAVFAFGRYEYRRIYEVPTQGNLFVESANMGQPRELTRAVTVMNDCDAVDLFPAQARVAGAETIDGISNYYSRGFVERWRYFVADNPGSCTARYAVWSTRTEVTLADLKFNADRVLAWLWINNVGLVRSPAPLAYPGLKAAGEEVFTVDNGRVITRYLYRMESPVSRVFAVPRHLAPADGLAEEEHALSRIAGTGAVTNIGVEAVSGSHLRFRGDFHADQALLASINYHRGWSLLVDGRPSPEPLQRGSFGMLRIPTSVGEHSYELIFRSRTTPFVPAFMLIGLGLLWLVASRDPDRRLPAVEPLLPPWRRRTVMAAGVAAVVILGAVASVVWMRAGKRVVPWLDPAWSQRIRLDTAGAPQTAAVNNFPVRVEMTPDDASFWSAVHPDGRDVRFTDASGTAVLPHEFEQFDASAKRMVAWVRVHALAPSAQTIGYVYFGDRSAAPPPSGEKVWDRFFVGVWHSAPAEASGDFNFGDEDWTVEFRVYPNPLNGRNYGLFEQGPPGAFNLYLHNGRYIVLERQNGARLSEVGFAVERIEPSTWTYVALERTRHHLRIALHGRPGEAHLVVPSFTHPILTGPMKFGAGRYGPLDGRLSEVRISKGVARSADWLLATNASLSADFVRKRAAEWRRTSPE